MQLALSGMLAKHGNSQSLEGSMEPEEIQTYVGKRVRLTLTPQAPRSPSIIGRLVGTLDAADGLIAFLEPDGDPGRRDSYHYHYIREIEPLEDVLSP